jgi:hypothetical protein
MIERRAKAEQRWRKGSASWIAPMLDQRFTGNLIRQVPLFITNVSLKGYNSGPW